MTKAEYVERYGVDAYEELKRKCRKYQKEYYQANKERKKEYYQANKERKKEYYQAIKEQVAEYQKKYRQSPLVRAKNAEHQKKYCQSPLGRAINIVKAYNRYDIKRGFDISNNVDKFWVVKNIFSGQSCIYCGDSDWTHLGCDRIDNSKPHTADNIVCSCGFCNKVRRDRYSVEEFKKKCNKN